jgi:hypothetical protein
VVEPPPRDGQGHLHYPLPYLVEPPHLHQPVFKVSSSTYIFRLYICIPWILSWIKNTLENFKHTFSFILSLLCSFLDNGTKFREKNPSLTGVILLGILKKENFVPESNM